MPPINMPDIMLAHNTERDRAWQRRFRRKIFYINFIFCVLLFMVSLFANLSFVFVFLPLAFAFADVVPGWDLLYLWVVSFAVVLRGLVISIALSLSMWVGYALMGGGNYGPIDLFAYVVDTGRE